MINTNYSEILVLVQIQLVNGKNNFPVRNNIINYTMKKNILFCLIAFIVMISVFCNQKFSTPNVSNLMLANIEALANNGESGGGQRITCYNKMEGHQGAPMEDKTWCDDCTPRPASKWSNPSECSK